MKENNISSVYRLNQYLAMAGLGARRKVEKEYILEERVSLNGRVIKSLGQKVNPEDEVRVDGKKIRLSQSFRYYVLNKPAGFVVSSIVHSGAQKKQRTIYSILPPSMHSLRYAGRLDKESRGLIVLSDDGKFIQSITHPRFSMPKRYRVLLDKVPENLSQRLCREGVVYENQSLRAEKIHVLSQREKCIDMTLKEGRKRQIRRMMECLGVQVLDIYRYALGALSLDDLALKEGTYAAVEKNCFFHE